MPSNPKQNVVVPDPATPEIAVDVELIVRGRPGWGSAFRRLHENSGLSQPALAKLLGVHKSTITKWKTRGTRPSKDVRRQALSAMGVPEELLLEHFGVSEKPSCSVASEIDEILEQSKGEAAAISRARIFERLSARAFGKLAVKALEKGDLKSLELFMKQGAEALEEAKSTPGYQPGSLYDSGGREVASDVSTPFELPHREQPKPEEPSLGPERASSFIRRSEAVSDAEVEASWAAERARACQEYIPPKQPPARSRRASMTVFV